MAETRIPIDFAHQLVPHLFGTSFPSSLLEMKLRVPPSASPKTPEAPTAHRNPSPFARVPHGVKSDPSDICRILVIGRPGAGKMTLLKRICETTEAPEIRRSEWTHIQSLLPLEPHTHYDINDELTFASHPRLRFHQAAGASGGLAEIDTFLKHRAAAGKFSQLVHAIW
ncbi:hypothetical protein FB45DRAFT_170531 [Roridomyces roridus]|uniref:G domain-containing protein n=1 Tax=Roridomyces roridus TaxID=1738132 RepID=A0AAD7BEC1_9AGAR|nr:hypothetical protein FB45DRAFT_170531 [Roridomyces roridus]